MSKFLVVSLIFIVPIVWIISEPNVFETLPGDLDSIANLSAVFQVREYLLMLFTPQNTGFINFNSTSLSPLFSLGGYPGLLLLISSFSLLISNPVFLMWVVIIGILTANSITFFYLLKEITQSEFAAFIGGFLISCNLILLGHIDNVNVLFNAFVFTSARYFIKAIRTNNFDDLVKSGIFLSLSFYFNPYISLALLILLLLFSVYKFPKFFFGKTIWKLGIPAILIAPYFAILFQIRYNRESIDYVGDLNAIQYLSLSVEDLLCTYEGALFGFKQNIFENPYFSKIRSAFPGLGLTLMFFTSLCFIPFKKSRVWLILLAGFILMSLGPEITFKNKVLFDSPLFSIFENLGLSSFFRIPSRFSLVFVTLMIILISMGVSMMIRRSRFYLIFMGTLLIINCIEFSSVARLHINHFELLQSDYNWIRYLRNYKPGTVTLLHFPSGLFTYEGDRNEHLYTYFQSKHKQNVINGWQSFYSKDRLAIDEQLKAVRKLTELFILADKLGVDFICLKVIRGSDEKLTDHLTRDHFSFEIASLDQDFILLRRKIKFIP